MNELSFLNETLSMINNKMDLNQIGLLGHSTGGAASGLYAMEHDIQSLVLLDPWFKPVEVEPVDEPLLIICSDEWKEEDQYTDIKKMSPYIYALEDSRHQDFTLSYKLSPVLQWFNQTGKDSSELQMKIILNHFNVHLKQLQDEMIRDTRLNYIEISSY
jgi:pimeloyl-ACP methyl ester carboxylesterase